MSSDALAAKDMQPDTDMSDGAVSPLLGKRKRTSDDEDDGSDLDDMPDDVDDGSDSDDMPDDLFIAPESDSDENDSESDDSDDSESDSDMEENDMPQDLYSSSVELPPACAAYDSRVGGITQQLQGIPQQVLDILVPHADNGKNINKQIKAAEKALELPKGPKVRIGLLGDAGAGKSSLLNSLTDIDDLAKSLSGGQSCTCVPTEYTRAFPAQRKEFAASVRYFDIKKIRHMLEEMLNDYNLFVFENDKYWEDDQRTQFKRAMQNALKTFRVLFCDLECFSSDQAAKDALKLNRENDSVEIIKIFLESCEKKLKDKITFEHGYAEFVEASTRAKLRDLADPLMGAKSSGDKPALWPLVRNVVIGVRESRVLEYVTIVDLPGISDTNNVRVELCKEYIKQCDSLWIVAPIKRVVDDGSVFNLLAAYAQRFKDKVAVICTHTDDGIDRNLAKFLDGEGCEVQSYFEDSQRWKDKKKEITQQVKNIKAMRKRRKPTKAMILETQDAEDGLKVLNAERDEIDATRFAFLVKARAAFITTQLQEEMQSHLSPGSTLPIFCVSNSHYGAHKGTSKVNGPRLPVEATNVPALRAHALALPAPLMMGALMAYSNHTITVFLKGANMWVDTTNIERRQELLDLVLAPQKLLDAQLQKHRANFKAVLKSGIVKAFDANMSQAVEVALKKFEEKKQKHTSTIRAFIRKNGSHSTKVCPKECWNESFTRVIYQLVEEQGSTWEKDFLDNMAVTKGWIIADLQHVVVSIGEQPSSSVLPMDKIKEMIQAQIVGIENIFEGIVTEYKKDFGNIGLDMTQDSDQNYFSRSMLPAYDSCKTDSGAGVTKRSLTKLEDHLSLATSDSPFAVLQRCAIKALNANDEKHINKRLMNKITKIFKETHKAFDRMVSKNKVEDPKEAKARLMLKAKIYKMQDDLDTVKKDLLAVKQKYADVVE